MMRALLLVLGLSGCSLAVDLSKLGATDGGVTGDVAITGPIAIATQQTNTEYLAVDGANIYWTGNATVSGCAIDGCNDKPTLLAFGQNEPAGIAAANGIVYWSGLHAASPVVKCAGLGCNNAPTTLVVADSPFLMVADNANVYWTGFSTPTGVFRCSVNGCASPTTLTTSTANALAIDATNVYWAGGPMIQACALGGCAAPTNVTSAPAYTLIASDGTNIFWTSTTTTLSSCPIASCTTPKVIVTTPDPFGGLAADAKSIYFTTTSSVLAKCPSTGCTTPTTLVSGFGAKDRILVDAANVYWLNRGTTDTIMKISKNP